MFVEFKTFSVNFMIKNNVDELCYLISEAKRVAEALGWFATVRLLDRAALEASTEGERQPQIAPGRQSRTRKRQTVGTGRT